MKIHHMTESEKKEHQEFLDHEFVEVFDDYVHEEVEAIKEEEKQLNLKKKGGKKV